MSNMTPLPPPDRHPLGLPAGSIRAILSIGIVAAFLVFLCHPQATHVPLYIQFMTFGLFLFFASHGRTIGTDGRSPLFLPRGTLRFLLVVAMIGGVGWEWYQDPAALISRLKPGATELEAWTTLFGAALGGFFLGWLVAHGPWRTAPAFQDFMAWFALIALLLVVVEAFWLGFIDHKAALMDNRPQWEALLLAVVSFYFGTRS